MDDLQDLSRAELEALCRGLRATVIRLQAQARRDTEGIDDAESAARVYRRLALRLIEQDQSAPSDTMNYDQAKPRRP